MFVFSRGVSLLFKVKQINMAEGGCVQRLLERSNRQTYHESGGANLRPQTTEVKVDFPSR